MFIIVHLFSLRIPCDCQEVTVTMSFSPVVSLEVSRSVSATYAFRGSEAATPR